MYREITTPIVADEFHRRLYGGEILLFRDLPAMHRLVQFSRALVERGFGGREALTIHQHLDLQEQTRLFIALGHEFTRSPEVKALWRELFAGIGLDVGRLARDRLRLRCQPPLPAETGQSRGVMRSTVPFHRDTWGTNLYAQINWWGPVYPITAERTMALYPALWDRPLRNSTADYDLQSLVTLAAERGREAITPEMAVPQLLETVDASLAMPVVIEPGSLVVFSSAHAHAGVPNFTDLARYSLETRTVWIPDLESGIGAPNIDGAARWSAPGFFYRVSDGKPLNEIVGGQRLEPYRPASLPANPSSVAPVM